MILFFWKSQVKQSKKTFDFHRVCLIAPQVVKCINAPQIPKTVICQMGLPLHLSAWRSFKIWFCWPWHFNNFCSNLQLTAEVLWFSFAPSLSHETGNLNDLHETLCWVLGRPSSSTHLINWGTFAIGACTTKESKWSYLGKNWAFFLINCPSVVFCSALKYKVWLHGWSRCEADIYD